MDAEKDWWWEVKDTDYQKFVAGKLACHVPTGIEGAVAESEHLFPFQRDLTQWALRRGRAAVFAATGLGKARIGITWAHRVSQHTDRPVLILAPCAVGPQTVTEGAKIGVRVTHVRDGAEIMRGTPGLYVTNYERLHRFDPSVFGGVVMDESSICKSFNSKTLAQLIEAFGKTAFRLALTATPSPNDYTELGTHAELLGICSRVEMLSEYFVHDGGETQKWRLKGHARGLFWKFVASWGALVRSPADLGYDASAYELPGLEVFHHVIEADQQSVAASGLLFAEPARGLMERRNARRGSVDARVEQCAALVQSDDNEQYVIWCGLNSEQDALAKILGESCVSIQGSTDDDDREALYLKWQRGEARHLITKARMFGYGVNMQHCARQAFVGISDSWEDYHQALRRCHRFGQKRIVKAHLFSSELEGEVLKNLQRKEADAQAMSEELSRETSDIVRSEVRGSSRTANEYAPAKRMKQASWCVSEKGDL